MPLDPRHHLLAAAGHVRPHEGAAGPGALAGRPRPERAHALLRPSGDRADIPPPALRPTLPLLVALRAGERAPARGSRRPRPGVAPVQVAGAGARALAREARRVGGRGRADLTSPRALPRASGHSCPCARGRSRSPSARIASLFHSRGPTATPATSPPGLTMKVAGIPDTPHAVAVAMSGSSRIGKVSARFLTYGSISVRGAPRSTETPRTTSPRPRYCRQSASSVGISSVQGRHQVAQKFRITSAFA